MATYGEWESIDDVESYQGGETTSVSEPSSRPHFNNNDWGVYHNRCGSRPTNNDGAFARIRGTEPVIERRRQLVKFKDSSEYQNWGLANFPDAEVDGWIREGNIPGVVFREGDPHTLEYALFNSRVDVEVQQATLKLLVATGQTALQCESDGVYPKDDPDAGKPKLESGRWGLEWDAVEQQHIVDFADIDDALEGASILRFSSDDFGTPEGAPAGVYYAILLTTETEQVILQSFYGVRGYRRTRSEVS